MNKEEVEDSQAGWWVSWLGVTLSLFGFLVYRPFFIGILGGLFGLAALKGRFKREAWISIAIAVIVIILGALGLTIAQSEQLGLFLY